MLQDREKKKETWFLSLFLVFLSFLFGEGWECTCLGYNRHEDAWFSAVPLEDIHFRLIGLSPAALSPTCRFSKAEGKRLRPHTHLLCWTRCVQGPPFDASIDGLTELLFFFQKTTSVFFALKLLL
mmetsp:Transcript_12335/g.23927  ORF Transcript_12335/g.23927 Transcript_12335/m.23927 type:complete len:125 (-) Transcript_12335:78-452(-)